MSEEEGSEPQGFYFVPLQKRYPNGNRDCRSTPGGYWKKTGEDHPVIGGGTEKILVFYAGKRKDGVKSSWVMKEYRLNLGPNEGRPDVLWVVCKIYKQEKERRGRGSSSVPQTPINTDKGRLHGLDDLPGSPMDSTISTPLRANMLGQNGSGSCLVDTPSPGDVSYVRKPGTASRGSSSRFQASSKNLREKLDTAEVMGNAEAGDNAQNTDQGMVVSDHTEPQAYYWGGSGIVSDVRLLPSHLEAVSGSSGCQVLLNVGECTGDQTRLERDGCQPSDASLQSFPERRMSVVGTAGQQGVAKSTPDAGQVVVKQEPMFDGPVPLLESQDMSSLLSGLAHDTQSQENFVQNLVVANQVRDVGKETMEVGREMEPGDGTDCANLAGQYFDQKCSQDETSLENLASPAPLASTVQLIGEGEDVRKWSGCKFSKGDDRLTLTQELNEEGYKNGTHLIGSPVGTQIAAVDDLTGGPNHRGNVQCTSRIPGQSRVVGGGPVTFSSSLLFQKQPKRSLFHAAGIGNGEGEEEIGFGNQSYELSAVVQGYTRLGCGYPQFITSQSSPQMGDVSRTPCEPHGMEILLASDKSNSQTTISYDILHPSIVGSSLRPHSGNTPIRSQRMNTFESGSRLGINSLDCGSDGITDVGDGGGIAELVSGVKRSSPGQPASVDGSFSKLARRGSGKDSSSPNSEAQSHGYGSPRDVEHSVIEKGSFFDGGRRKLKRLAPIPGRDEPLQPITRISAHTLEGHQDLGQTCPPSLLEVSHSSVMVGRGERTPPVLPVPSRRSGTHYGDDCLPLVCGMEDKEERTGGSTGLGHFEDVWSSRAVKYLLGGDETITGPPTPSSQDQSLDRYFAEDIPRLSDGSQDC
ncbi:hypothetical protein CBR_g39673 [Chara braunii]|uniref:NAC domain-containing protein n=1 Tax=Chara braunii TaxID=69332 RepID=A0A388K1G2_CHABU|nr:hypothetical protein CBR_g39673 [Chara braunii]|eukprot:GBG63892.1 hypothetical protein CBR_g39673 [Chara braunii]